MSSKFFRFNKQNNDDRNINLKKFEIMLKVDTTTTTPTYAFKHNYPGSDNIYKNVIVNKGQIQISIDLNDEFYPISSIFWGKDYNTFKCDAKDGDNLNFKITTDNNKLPFVIENNNLKIMVPMSVNALELGVSSLSNALRCKSKEFVFGKIVVLYTTDESENLVATGGTKELFTHNNKYVGIC